jgi:hypothetical protein
VIAEKFLKTVKRSLLPEGFYVDACQEKPHPRDFSAIYYWLSLTRLHCSALWHHWYQLRWFNSNIAFVEGKTFAMQLRHLLPPH